MSDIPQDQMGDVWPEARPGPEGADYGSVTLSPTGSFQVRSFQTFTLVYTVGEYGLDDTGALKIVQRWTGDHGHVQFADPKAANFVTATASNGVNLRLYAEPYPHQRPWYNGLRITVERGFMRPGDTITVTYGDRAEGSPGYRLQTFCETNFEFKVLADPCATGVFLPVGAPSITITAGSPENWVLVAPTARRVGEPFSLGLRAEDYWGNVTGAFSGNLRLEASTEVSGMPDTIEYPTGQRGVRVDGLRLDGSGTTRFFLKDSNGTLLARSNPIVTSSDGAVSYWGDLHGQSGETVGINTMRRYLEFGREAAFLDVMSHQANDFQITNAFWREINALSLEFNEDGRFVVFPGYEWSGNTPVGGDHNVFFRTEGRQIHRSSHALLTDRSDIGTDARTVSDLFTALKDEDCVLFAHVGGRPADIAFDHDHSLRTAVEVHSDWGTFEWIMTDAFRLGYRVGLVCNSDGHKGAPGACHPGASEFGAYSGLTCFFTDHLSRDGIFDSLRARRHYGTSGCRLHLEVEASLGSDGSLLTVNPQAGPRQTIDCNTAVMGDIVSSSQTVVPVKVTCNAQAPIERIDVLSGDQIVDTFRSYTASDLGDRIRVIWEGAEYRGRGRQTHWNGKIRVTGATLSRFHKINAWNHERPFFQDGDNTICFDAVTTGNFGGCDLWLDGAGPGHIYFDSSIINGQFDLDQIGIDDLTLEAGGLDRRVRVFRLPETLAEMDCTFTAQVPLVSGRDNPIWVRVTTEDGHKAWSSPIYHIE